MHTTKVFSKLLNAYINPDVRVIALKGGTRSSKTISTLQLINHIALRSSKPRLISTVSENLPHLKRGCIRDFKETVLGANGIFERDRWHDTEKTYSYDKGRIEFFGCDNPSKVHGSARDILFANEANYIEYEVYRQLAVRTREKIIIDWNPSVECYIDEFIIPRKDCVVIHSTYLDNDTLSPSQISEIEANRDIDANWWNVYGLGLTGSAEGLCIKNWDIVDRLPPRSTWKNAYIGIDFGWSAQSAVILIVESQGEMYHHELAYAPFLDNPQIAEVIQNSGFADIEAICDSAEPKSIFELQALGINAQATTDKAIPSGIALMNRYKKHFTKESINSISENRKYSYPKDPTTGDYGTHPVKKFCHAKDAERYVYLSRFREYGTMSASKAR